MANPPSVETSDPNRNIPPSGFEMPEGRTFLGHPRGLFLLFIVEMWERFSYYGMRALLVLYLIERLQPDPKKGLFTDQLVNPGREWAEGDANFLYGWYTGLAYLLPVFGGILADKLLGTHRSMLLGGIVIALGHLVLAVSGFGDLAHNDVGMSTFIGGLALIIIGTGYFKPTVSVMVGQLYQPGDARRDGGFSIFYMGINLGAFLCAFVCGTLGQQVGWHWGFGSAAVGMLLGLFTYTIFKPLYLKGIGAPPAGAKNLTVPLLVGSCGVSALVGWMYHIGVFTQIRHGLEAFFGNQYASAACVLAVVAAALWFVMIQKPGEKGAVLAIFLFMLFNAFFWIAFEQAGSTLNVFAERSTNLDFFGIYEIPATWFQSVNAGLIILFAPLFAWLWGALGKRGLNPSQPLKIAYGLILLGLGYLFIVWGAKLNFDSGAKVSMFFLFATYFLHTMGELCLSPTGLSFVSKVAPVRYVSLLMGIWFISSFIANLGGGLIASKVEAIEKGEIRLPWQGTALEMGGRADYFMLFVISSIGMGVIVLVLSPWLKKLYGGKA